MGIQVEMLTLNASALDVTSADCLIFRWRMSEEIMKWELGSVLQIGLRLGNEAAASLDEAAVRTENNYADCKPGARYLPMAMHMPSSDPYGPPTLQIGRIDMAVRRIGGLVVCCDFTEQERRGHHRQCGCNTHDGKRLWKVFTPNFRGAQPRRI